MQMINTCSEQIEGYQWTNSGIQEQDNKFKDTCNRYIYTCSEQIEGYKKTDLRKLVIDTYIHDKYMQWQIEGYQWTNGGIVVNKFRDAS